MIDDGAEIIAHAGMVGTEEAIGFARAAATIPGEGVPAAFLERERHPANVFGGGFAFEAVPDDGEALVLPLRPIEVKEVAIRKLEALALDFRSPDTPKEGGVDRREMTSPQAERSAVGGGDEGHSGLMRTG